MRSQDEFVAARQRDWDELDQLLSQGGGFRRLPPVSIARAAALYRAVSSDLMRAESAGYSPDVIALLDGLAARAHNTLYWKTHDVVLQPGEHARFKAINRAGWAVFGFLMVLGAAPLGLTFERET